MCFAFASTGISGNLAFLQSVLSCAWGNFQLFCGHPVICFRQSAVLLSSDHRGAVCINSCEVGSFILEYSGEFPHVMQRLDQASLRTAAVDNWRQGGISTTELLIVLNSVAGRSFEDLSLYPVFPRVLASFTSHDFLEEIGMLRDLSQPLLVFSDKDPEHVTLKARMEAQGYHHCENVSNAAHVTSYMLRLEPFFGVQLKFHGGFDQVERIFTSIPSQMSVSAQTAGEFSPELFCCPEVFENLNRIRLDNGDHLDLELPAWSQSAFEFVELHRYALESAPVRRQIHHWIDLVFGFKRCGAKAVEAMNLYNPLCYGDARLSPEHEAMRKEWVLSCGQVPEQIFDSPCPPWVSEESAGISGIEFRLNPPERAARISLHVGRGMLVADSVCVYDGGLFTAVNICVSSRERFVAVTLAQSAVQVFRTGLVGGRITALVRQAVLVRAAPRFSVLNDRQMICATVYKDEIVLESIVKRHRDQCH